MVYNNVGIKGVGSHLPSKVVTNYDLEKSVDTTHSWIKDKLGIDERRVAEESPSEMGYKAALKALESANMGIDDIDLIIVATSSPEKISPSTACIIHNKFNIDRDIPAFDINAVCSGFVYAINLMIPLISHKVHKNVLIIATEAYSKHTDWTNQHSVFFGDGAGAIVLGYDEEGWMSFESSANGKEIVANEVGLPMDKVKTVMNKYANIAGASVPIALDDAIMNKQINKGDIIVFTAIGSGWAWGSTIMKWVK